MATLNKKIGSGVLWNLASMFMSRGASTLFMLFLARLLTPEAFGLIAMVTVVFELSNTFVNSGLETALVRSKAVSRADLNTVFLSNLVLSGVVYIALFLAAPIVADFYEQTELAALIQVMGLVVFINASTVVQTAVLTRNMNFRAQMKANTLGVVASGVLAVAAAFAGWGVWSLVVQMLSSAFVSAIILWLTSSWRPRWQFSTESFTRLFRFGRNLLIERSLEVLFQNSYVMVIGRLFSTEITGLYFFARKVSNLIAQQLTGAVQRATFPALATLQDDNVALLHKYRQIMQLIMFIIAPIMGLLAGLAHPLINVLFGEKWLGAIPYLQVLCMIGMLYPIHALNISLLNVKGRSDLVLKVGLLKKSVNLTLLFLAIPYGVFGIVLSQLIGSVLALIPNTYFSARLVNYNLLTQLTDAIIPVMSALLAALLVGYLYSVSHLSAFWGLMCGSLLGGSVYILATFLFKAEGLKFFLNKFKEKFLMRRYI
ncbi:lipopolysaccharide biosynthesis protein [Oceanisphaera ostreae]|uniref:Lipopolysaccharide biosynthesis protein n=1 Tax=Oceanisphaera ostreae TaxID=914151 RepID=A0ABW3KG47_9GAMM